MKAYRDLFPDVTWWLCFGAFAPPALPEAVQALALDDRAQGDDAIKTPAPSETGARPEGT